MLIFALFFKEEQIGDTTEKTHARPEAAPVLS
jgi:hypothetical protein